jgi:hypothetical protein
MESEERGLAVAISHILVQCSFDDIPAQKKHVKGYLHRNNWIQE